MLEIAFLDPVTGEVREAINMRALLDALKSLKV